jgi:hypothetical protein
MTIIKYIGTVLSALSGSILNLKYNSNCSNSLWVDQLIIYLPLQMPWLNVKASLDSLSPSKLSSSNLKLWLQLNIFGNTNIPYWKESEPIIKIKKNQKNNKIERFCFGFSINQVTICYFFICVIVLFFRIKIHTFNAGRI